MKPKHFITSLATLVLSANFLLPGAALAALTGTQTVSQIINCTAIGGLTFEITNSPNQVNLDDVAVTPGAQDSFDALLDDDTDLDTANELIITDNRSDGFANCPTTAPGFTVTAEITTTLTDQVNLIETIPDSQFYIITSNEFAVDPAGTTFTDGEEVFYSAAEDPTGNIYDIDAPFLYDDVGRLDATVFDKFNDSDSYKFQCGAGDAADACNDAWPTANTLDSAITIISTSTGHNGFIVTGSAVYGEVPANQAGGDYQGTITYTLSTL